MSVAKSLASSIARQVAQLVALADGGGTSYRAETTAYQARVNSDGGTMTTAGLQFVDSLFSHAETNSLTINRGYVFGNACNVNANVERRVLELTGDGEEFTADAASSDSIIHPDCNGMMTHQGRVAQTGRIKLATEQLFDNTDWSIFLYFQKPLVDTDDAAENTIVASQYSTGANGHFRISAQQVGPTSVTPVNGTTKAIRSSNYGGGGLIEPTALFITYDTSTREMIVRDVANGTSQTTAMPADFTSGLPTHLSVAQILSTNAGRPNDIAYMGLLKYDGILSDAQMDSVWENFRDNHQLVADYALIYGNSVTSGSDAAEATTNSGRNWPQQITVLANRNNVIILRPYGMGGKTLYYMRDTDFTKPTGSSYPGSYPVVTVGALGDTVQYWGPRWKPTILVLDENQNTLSNSSVNVTYDIDWAGTVGNPGIARHIIDKLRSYGRSDMLVVCGTMIAQGNEGKSYATIIAEEGTPTFALTRKNLRDWSASIRTDSAGLYDAVYDLYPEFNLGWDVAADGNAEDPINDYPNGDTATYFYDDHQHPNFAGHTLMAAGYWAAIDSIRTR